MSNPVLESSRYILTTARDVSINRRGVRETAELIAKSILSSHDTYTDDPSQPPDPNKYDWYSHPLHPSPPPPPPSATEAQRRESEDGILDWIFLVSVLNFSFWSDVELDGEKVGGKRFGKGIVVERDGERNCEWFTGYWSLLACLRGAERAGIPITSPKAYRQRDGTLTDEQLRGVFGGGWQDDETEKHPSRGGSDVMEPMPLVEERIVRMRDAGEVLCQKYDGSFRNMIDAVGGDPMRLVKLVVEEIESFRDDGIWNGREVYFWKRAQILVAESWAALPHLFKPTTIHLLTAFPDYRIPQILQSFDVLTYSPHLTSRLESRTLLPNRGREEMEIRAGAVAGVEDVRLALEELLGDKAKAPVAIELDFWLWDLAKDLEKEGRGGLKLEHHRTRCCFY